MTRDWVYGEALKDVFPLLDGKDLASCMQVCRQWRDIAKDDYFWKCACGKRWPSVCKRPPSISYHKLFVTFSKPQSPRPLLPSGLLFEYLEFYIDIWADYSLIFSEAVSGTMLRKGIKNPPAGVPDTLKAHMNNSDYKMIMPVEPRFTLSILQTITVSVMVSRKDTKQMAYLLNQSLIEYFDGSAFIALAYDFLTFAPKHPFISGIRAWLSLLFMAHKDEHVIDVFGIEVDFCDAASSENEVLWLLDMLDWK